ncbi:MAG: hypothetical protein PQJ59_03605 [Spirochaetales bacterium]|nr:hypothetical protein [Spirochaetales bacterium]
MLFRKFLVLFTCIAALMACDTGSGASEEIIIYLTVDEDDETVSTEFSCDAGEDQSITSLWETVTLGGSVKYASGDSIDYIWMASPNNPSTVTLSDYYMETVSFDVGFDLDEGDYTFVLMANDGNETVSDTVVITLDYMDKLLASDGAASDNFGYSVSLSSDGSTALVGAVGDDDNGSESGSAYVFTLDGGSWSQSEKLTASDGAEYDLFGRSVCLSSDGSTALIGASYDDDDDMGSDSGSAYVFTLDGGSWSETKLLASDGAAYDSFGCSVSLSSDGSTALVGATPDDDTGSYYGSAYVFTLDGGSWSQSEKLTASDGAEDDYFGCSVSLSSDGSTALIGAGGDDDNGIDSGSAYVFTLDGGSWSETKLIASDGAEYDLFGRSVCLSSDGSTALIGAYWDDDNGSASGSAYVFTFDGVVWSQSEKLIASDGAAYDLFGYSVSLSSDGSTALIGSVGVDYSGVFSFGTDGWSQTGTLTAVDGAEGDMFGYSVSLSSDGSTALVGAYLDGDNGSAYTFNLSY